MQNNEPTIGQMNEAIAKFMGAKVNGHWVTIPHRKYSLRSSFYPAQLKYHASWDWLMPVGKRIHEVFQEDMKNMPPHTISHGDSLEIDIYCAIMSYDIEKAHKAIHALIQWYNNQTTTN